MAAKARLRQVLALTLLLVPLPALDARADPDPTLPSKPNHVFLHARFTPSRCWPLLFGNPSPVSKIQHLTPGNAQGKSPELDSLLEGRPIGPDPQIAVGEKYLLALDSGAYTFYERSSGDPVPSPTDAAGCVLPMSGYFTNLFAPLLSNKDPDSGAANSSNVNALIDLPSGSRVCHRNDIFEADSGCINEVYDARAFYEPGRGRFWIAAAARNKVWKCKEREGDGTCSSSCPARTYCDEKRCIACGNEARRFVFVAVSKTDDPRDGFFEYALVEDYADWPMFSVNNDRLIVTHLTGKRVFVFNAKKLADGASQDPFIRSYGVTHATFSEVDAITPVTQRDEGGISYLLGQRGNDLHIYAFKDSTPVPAHVKVPLTRPPNWWMNPVFRNGTFHFAYDRLADAAKDRYVIDVFSIPIQTSQSLAISYGAPDRHTLSGSEDASLRIPGLEVETNDVIGVWYQRYPRGTGTPDVRYSVLYPQEDEFRESQKLHFGRSRPNDQDAFAGSLDLPGGASDPSDVAIWFTHAYTDTDGSFLQAIGSIKPGCGEGMISCGTTCANTLSDKDNCGGCGIKCAIGCRGGQCCEPCECLAGSTVCATNACNKICGDHY